MTAIETVREFYESLVGSAKMSEHGEKPMFLMAILRYMTERKVYNVTLLDLFNIRHTRFIKRLFLILANRRLAAPESSWDRVTKDGEMKRITEKYTENVADISKSIADLKPKEVKQLYDEFLARYKNRPINQDSLKLS